MKMSKTQLAVKLSSLLIGNTRDGVDAQLIKERQGNTSANVQDFLKCGLDRKDLIFAITEALNDVEPIYLDREHKGSCQKNRRLFSSAWSKVFAGYTLKISGTINYPVVVEEKAKEKDVYQPYINALKKLGDILPARETSAIGVILAERIEIDKVNLKDAKTNESKRALEIQKKRTEMITSQVTESFLALGIKPTAAQLESNVQKVLEAQG